MSEKHRNLIAFSLILLGFCLIAVGVLRGEHTVIWRKAVNICMECIGLG